MAHWNNNSYYDDSYESSYYDDYEEDYYSSESCYSDGTEYEFIDLTDAEINMVNSRLPYFITPTSISKVRNHYLWDKYQQKKGIYTRNHGAALNEYSLWHATSEENAEAIVAHNFDKRFTVRGLHGYGVSFSTDAGYSDFHCNSNVGDDRALILTNVLVGKTCESFPYMKFPSHGCDTAVSKQGTVYVKFAKHEYYPAYVVYYSSRYYRADNTKYGPVPVDIGYNNGDY